ncbi:hypothetical protein [Gandjariella thermophila]|nr:hypothetical protein [Gandjariella thermophila]
MTNVQVTEGAQRVHLDPYCSLVPRLVGIADTNALLSSVENDCRKGFRSRLRRMTAFGTAVLYAPDHVYGEMYRRLPKVAKSSPVPLAVLRAHFEQYYLPILRFVTVAEADVSDDQVLAITDLDDLPTGRLAKLIGPCVVFSDDKHLRKPGFAPQDWRVVAGLAADLAEGVSKQNVAGALAVSPGWALTALVRFVGRRFGVSPGLLGGLVAVGATLLLTDSQRRTRLGRSFEQYGIPVLEAVFTAIEEARLQEEASIVALQEVLLAAPSEPSVKQQVAIVLARQTEPLLASEVQALIRDYFPAATVPTVAEVRAVLRGHPEFVQYRQYRWQFGRCAVPSSAAS